MSSEQCFMGVCFIPLDVRSPSLFSFSEFLAGLALMVLAWTIADIRYRFRIRTAPIPLQGFTFYIVAAVGGLTLLTDLWRAEHWLVPRGSLLTPAAWQAILASIFLLTFLTWAWFAFIKPPKFGKRNAKRFAQTLYRSILKGSPTELAVIADEITYSAKAFVSYATDRDPIRHYRINKESRESEPGPPKIEAYANDLLLLIADKRFCRTIVESSPATALAIFQEIRESQKYRVKVQTFAKNIVNEAIINKDSFLYHEAEGYESGLIGYHKPLSQAIFSDYRMVESVGTLLDPDILGNRKWDHEQWEAYLRVVLITLNDYVEKGNISHSFILYRTKEYISFAVSDVYKINGLNISLDDDTYLRLRVVVDFINKAVEVLGKKDVPGYIKLRLREEDEFKNESFYDQIAAMIFEVIHAASTVKTPTWGCWTIQHNTVWGRILNSHRLNNQAGKVVKFKVRRLIYNEVAKMNEFPNFMGSRLLGLCLNVMGLKLRTGGYDKDSRALHIAILAWTRKNYAWLYAYNPRIAEDCLVDSMSYDAENRRIVKTYPAEGLRREPRYDYLEIAPALADEGQ